MNEEFITALNQLELERGLDKRELLTSFEEALHQAYIRNIAHNREVEVEVHIDPESGALDVLEIKRIVESVENPDREVALAEAREIDPNAEVGGEMEFPVDFEQYSRIAVQTAKQVFLQKTREKERQKVYDEYRDRLGDVITALVQRVDNKGNVFVDLGRGEAIMPAREQIPGERYTVGTRLKVFISKVELTPRGPSILVSRGAPELLAYLMRQEIPEIADGTVEIKAIAREAGQRSKVAVASRNSNVDPIGACIGHRGNRIQAVTGELQRERVDIIQWDSTSKEFVRNALSPARVGAIELDTKGGKATVTVNSDQLSLAIGKGGQNVRLAARLTGFKIDLVEAQPAQSLDQALAAASATPKGAPARSAPSDSAQAKFDSLFKAPEAPSGTAPAEGEPGGEGTPGQAAENVPDADASAEPNGEKAPADRDQSDSENEEERTDRPPA
jgi:N utilization substance protein A